MNRADFGFGAVIPIIILAGVLTVLALFERHARTDKAALELWAALHPVDPASFEGGDPVVAARANALAREIEGMTFIADCVSAQSPPQCVRGEEEKAVRHYLNEQAVRSPRLAWAMAGLAGEMGFAVPAEWKTSYDPLAVATVEMAP